MTEGIEFRGQSYPARCSNCHLPIENTAIVLLETNLIFCDEDCVVGFVDSRTANITIGEGKAKCILN